MHFHMLLDHYLNCYDAVLKGYLTAHDTDKYWHLFCHLLEQAILHHTSGARLGEDYKLVGRGKEMVIMRTHDPSFHSHTDGHYDEMGDNWQCQLLNQANRCSHLANAISALSRSQSDSPHYKDQLKTVEATMGHVIKYVEWQRFNY